MMNDIPASAYAQDAANFNRQLLMEINNKIGGLEKRIMIIEAFMSKMNFDE